MAFSTGIDRWTGATLSDWGHVLQSLHVIFTTPIGARVMCRSFGSAIPALLGRENITPSTLAKFWTAIILSIEPHQLHSALRELGEPRFRVRQISYPGHSNSEQDARQGRIGIRLDGDYMPRALQGDLTVERPETVIL